MSDFWKIFGQYLCWLLGIIVRYYIGCNAQGISSVTYIRGRGMHSGFGLFCAPADRSCTNHVVGGMSGVSKGRKATIVRKVSGTMFFSFLSIYLGGRGHSLCLFPFIYLQDVYVCGSGLPLVCYLDLFGTS